MVEDNSKQLAIHKVAILVKELIGDRSIRRTAEDAGVAASYITGILKERHLPSADILRKLSSPNAKPQNGVTLEDLMVAAGYQNDYVKEAVKDVIYDGIVNIEGEMTTRSIYKEKSLDRASKYYKLLEDTYISSEKRKSRMQEISMFEKLATGAVFKALADKGIAFSNANDIVGIRGFKADMVINVSDQPIREWWFEYKYCWEKSYGFFGIKRTLGHFMFIEPEQDRKISLVINSRDVFEMLCGYKDKLAYRGDLSVILIDETYSIVQEEYLAHYDMNKKETEFYII